MTWSSYTSGDLCTAKSAATKSRADHPTLVLTTCILASSLAFVDGSVVNVGLPAIGHSLQGDAADLQWVINAYLLPLSALLLLGGALGDRFGYRSALVLGTTLFAFGSAWCAMAASLPWLLAARGLQGVGAALLLPNSLAIMASAFFGEARGRAVGTWAAASAIAGAVGPVLGGWLIDVSGWREIFLINLPLALAAIGLALVFVKELPANAQRPPLDWLGALLATASLGALTWGLTAGAGPAGWSGTAWSTILVGLAVGAAFIWIEKRRGEGAMMPVALFGSHTFVGLTVMTLLLYGALGGLLVLVPYVLIQGASYSGTAAGAALLPFPLVLALTSRPMGGIAARIGPRVPLTLGSVAVAAGFLLLLGVGPNASYWSSAFLPILVIALGISAVATPLTTAVLASVDAHHTGSASGLNSAVARAGGLVATALLGGVFAQSRPGLFHAFHAAAIACAAVSIVAGAVAFTLVRNGASTAAK
ncbi:MAG TPA: MFS transporter [Steroidobacteraceae bacterium]